MNRRDFLKTAIASAAATQVTSLVAQEAPKLNKVSSLSNGPQVARRMLRNTDISVPLLGYGMMRLPTNGDKIDYEKAEALVKRALEAGINYFDTAYFYHKGQSEKFCGDILPKFPRDSYYLTSKMPVGLCKTEADVERIFNEQLERCKADYFDFYLFHNMNANVWKTATKLHVWDFLQKKKAEGKVRKIGFSFHDKYEHLKKIADAYPWDFAQIQLNILDWELYHSREQYEILTERNIPVVIMEPLRGGALASLSQDANEILKKANPNLTTAAWAFRFVASLPNVLTILSGMTKMEHLEENIKTFSEFKPLTDDERKVLDEAVQAYRKAGAIPCTGCRYCMPCPAGVEISTIFGLYNQFKLNNNKWQFKNGYNGIPDDARVDSCVECESCLKKCPQQLQIPELLKKVEAEVKQN